MAPQNRTGRTPSVEEALARVHSAGADTAPAPAPETHAFDALAQQLYAETSAGAEVPMSDSALYASEPDLVNGTEVGMQDMGIVEDFEPEPSDAEVVSDDELAPAGAALEPAAPELMDSGQLLESLRDSSRTAVRRLAGVPNTAIRRPQGNAIVPTGAEGDAITELSKEVERAVASAVAAANYQQDVEQRATALASTIVADAAAEAERTVASAKLERETILATASSQARELVSNGRAQRDAILARAQAKAQGIVEQSEIELARRVHAIAQRTDAIVEIAESVAGRLAAGNLTGEQLAHFIAALTAATEQALTQGEHGENSEH